MKLTLIILLLLITGCGTPQVQDRDPKKRAVIYDPRGKVQNHVIIQDDYITIYDKDWQSKAYGKTTN